jgi:hypothetical protein
MICSVAMGKVITVAIVRLAENSKITSHALGRSFLEQETEEQLKIAPAPSQLNIVKPFHMRKPFLNFPPTQLAQKTVVTPPKLVNTKAADEKKEKERRKKRKKKLEEAKDTSVAKAPAPRPVYQIPLDTPVTPPSNLGYAFPKTQSNTIQPAQAAITVPAIANQEILRFRVQPNTKISIRLKFWPMKVKAIRFQQ